MKKLLAVLACAVTVCACVASIFAQEPGAAPAQTPQAMVTDGMELAAENGRLALYADSKTGAVALYQKSSGYTWRSSPDTSGDEELGDGKKRLMESQMEIRYYDEKSMSQERVSRVACVDKNGLTASRQANGVLFSYSFVNEKITVPLSYTLKDDHLQVSVPLDLVKEEGANRLADISVLPYLGAANTTEEGYFFVPDGSGALIRFNNGKYKGTAYEQPIYGADTVSFQDKKADAALNALLPVMGVSKEGGGLLSVISSGAPFAKANAYVAGMKKTYNAAFFSFCYRPYDTVLLDSSSERAKEVVVLAEKPASCGSFTVDLYPLEEGNTYSDMAVKYRGVLEEQGLLEKSAMAADLPFYINSYGAVQKKGSVFFIPANVMKPLTTYQGAAQMLKDVSGAGVRNIVFSYEGWAQGGVTGKLPVKGKYESVLGGKKDFEALAATAEELGAVFLPGISLGDFHTAGNGYGKSSATAKTLNGGPSLQYRLYAFCRMKNDSYPPYYLLAPRLFTGTLEKFQSSYRLSLPGVSLKSLGGNLYSDSSGQGYDREQTSQLAAQALRAAKDKWGTVLTSGGNLYAALAADYLSDVPGDSSRFDVADESVPFYQMVMSGSKSYALPSVNLSYDAQREFLKALEMGASICYDFNMENFAETVGTPIEAVYNSNYRDWLETAAQQYEKLNEVYKQTGNHRISSHKQLSENVYETSYENGVKVVVNYGAEAASVQGLAVGPMDYAVLR